jgi:hypothetical protein
MLNKYLRKFEVAPVFNEGEVRHLLSPRDGVVYSFVVEDPDAPGTLTDFVSFYSLPSTVIKGELHATLRAAYSYYNVANKARRLLCISTRPTLNRRPKSTPYLSLQRSLTSFSSCLLQCIN